MSETTVNIPLELFRTLVLLQAHYAWLLNVRDGGERRPVALRADLEQLLTRNEIDARVRLIEG